MKKLLFVIAVACVLAACGGVTKEQQAKIDSLKKDSIEKVKKDSIAAVVEKAKQDSIAAAEKKGGKKKAVKK